MGELYLSKTVDKKTKRYCRPSSVQWWVAKEMELRDAQGRMGERGDTNRTMGAELNFCCLKPNVN